MIDQLDLAGTLAPLIPDESDMSDVPLVAEMEVMARLVNANLGLRVLTAGWGDFDSHAGQPNQHSNRMRELNAAITRFFQVLTPAWSSRVTIVTFSEFGRTSWSNDGSGTDHGTAAPHFVLGANVRGGRYGQRPSLAGLGRWDRMPFHVDFRDYYGSVIDGWLGGGASDVLGGRAVQDLGLFARPPGVVPPLPPGGAGSGGGTTQPGGAGAAGQFLSITPSRVCDTRKGIGGRRGPIGPGQTMRLQVAGRGGVPDTGVLAVAVSVASVDATQHGYFSVFPSNAPVTTSASLNPHPGRPVSNMTIVGVGPDGCIGVYNAHGTAHCVVDVMGYVRSEPASRLTPLVPGRVLDTRRGTGAPLRRVRAGGVIDLVVAGHGGVPAHGVDSVVLNVAAVEPSGPGFLSVWPSGLPRPLVASLNYRAGRNLSNLVICKLGAGGVVSLFASGADLDLVADVVGYFSASGASHVAVTPARLLDTRHGHGARRGVVRGGSEIELAVVGVGGVARDAKAVILNVTATDTTSDTFVTVYPNGVGRPHASSLNVMSGDTVGNLVIAKVGSNGRVRLFNRAGAVNLVADVTGYFV